MTIYPAGAPTVLQASTPPRQTQAARVFSAVFDWLGISVLALSVCSFICQYGFGAFS